MIRIFSPAVFLAFTLVALLLIGNIIALYVITVFVNYEMALLSALPGWAGGLSILVWLLAGLAAAMVAGAAVLWVKRSEALWARLYYLLLTCCAVALVYLLVENGLGHI